MRARDVNGLWPTLAVAAPVLVIVGFFSVDAGGTTPADGRGALLTRDLLMDPGRRVTGSAIGMTGALLLVPVAAAMRLRLRAAAPLDVAAFGFAVVATTGALIHGGFRLSVSGLGDDPTAAAEVARILAVLEPVGFIVLTWGLAGLAISLSIAGVRDRLLPRWISAVGLLLVLAAVASSGSDRGGFALLLLAWVAAASAVSLRSSTSPGPASEGDVPI